MTLMETACQFFERHLTDEHRRFLGERYGYAKETIERAHIGYAPTGETDLLLHLMDRGYSGGEIRQSGLFTTGDRIRPLWRGRIMFTYLVGGIPSFFIGRQTDETADGLQGKYIKQKVLPAGPNEPIYGIDTVRDGELLVITEGIADAISVHQAGYPCISPVTTGFKQARIDDAAAICKRAALVFIVNDNEQNEAGLNGAIRTAIALSAHGIEAHLGIIPREEHLEKVDLNDFLRSGGDLRALFMHAGPATEHPRYRKHLREAWKASGEAIAAEHRRARARPRKEGDDIERLKAAMPSISMLTGIAPGRRGPHPVYGSSTGQNFAVTADGEGWCSFHEGDERGKGGDLLKLIALMEGFLDDERLPLRGEAFRETIEFCKARWIPKQCTDNIPANLPGGYHDRNRGFTGR